MWSALGLASISQEMFLTNLFGIKALIVAILAYSYSRAGRGEEVYVWGRIKIRRKVWIPIALSVSLAISAWARNVLSLQVMMLIVLTGLSGFAGLCIGYGAGSPLRRWLGRVGQQFAVGLLQGGGLSVCLGLYYQHWGLLSLACIVPCITLGALGGWADSDLDASHKEGLYALLLVAVPAMMV